VTQEDFRPIFDRVCTHFAVGEETRAIAWRACFGYSGRSSYLLDRVVDIYRMLDNTTGPWVPKG
jgi:hypothetical protein